MENVMKQVEGGVCAAKGFSANGLNCGLNPNKEKNDLALIYSEKMCNAAAVYTTNKVKGAPILVTKKNLAASGNHAQAVLGSAKMVLETGMHPGELKDMVCSPAGTTIQAVRVLEERGMRSSVIEAMMKCLDISRNM